MEDESQVPKRSIPIVAAVAMLFIGSIACLISKAKLWKKVKAREGSEEPNKSLAE